MTSEPVNQPGPPDDLEQLRAEIEQTREHLGDTVDQLAAKADVKAQAQAKAADLTQRAKDTAGQARQHAATPSARSGSRLQTRLLRRGSGRPRRPRPGRSNCRRGRRRA